MLTSMIPLMKKAREEGHCVPAMSASDETTARIIIQAAEKKNAPVILICMKNNARDIVYFGRVVSDLAAHATVPVALCLDHSSSFEDAIWGIKAGFTDIMVDRSMLSYEENVAQVSELVKIAHAVGVGVEAELGHVGVADNYDVDGNTGLTDPEEAVRFVKETNVDALAVAVGTAHGAYKGLPNIRFELLKELREKVEVPLVMHGGSGSGDENLTKSAQLGICKLNIANVLYRGAIEELEAHDLTGSGAYGLFKHLYNGYEKVALHYFDVCLATNKNDIVKNVSQREINLNPELKEV